MNAEELRMHECMKLALDFEPPNTGSAVASLENLKSLQNVLASYPQQVSLEKLINELDKVRKRHNEVFFGRIRTEMAGAYHECVLTAIAMAQDFYKSQL